jgi:FAD/FMN-containing dehydrogenase
MFGHVDAGVLHVRPALDMCDPQQEVLMKQISDDVVALTAKYGGLLWGNTAKASAPSTARRSLAKNFTASCAKSKRRSIRITA